MFAWKVPAHRGQVTPRWYLPKIGTPVKSGAATLNHISTDCLHVLAILARQLNVAGIATREPGIILQAVLGQPCQVELFVVTVMEVHVMLLALMRNHGTGEQQRFH